jgi:hypothetical protein
MTRVRAVKSVAPHRRPAISPRRRPYSARCHYDAAKQLTQDAGAYLEPGLASGSPVYWSIYGTLFLAGAMAASRSEDRDSTRGFLAEARAGSAQARA